MRNAAIALSILSIIINVSGAYIRDSFAFPDFRPDITHIRNAWNIQKCIYVSFWVMAILGVLISSLDIYFLFIQNRSYPYSLYAVIISGSIFSLGVMLMISTHRSLRRTSLMLKKGGFLRGC